MSTLGLRLRQTDIKGVRTSHRFSEPSQERHEATLPQHHRCSLSPLLPAAGDSARVPTLLRQELLRLASKKSILRSGKSPHPHSTYPPTMCTSCVRKITKKKKHLSKNLKPPRIHRKTSKHQRPPSPHQLSCEFTSRSPNYSGIRSRAASAREAQRARHGGPLFQKRQSFEAESKMHSLSWAHCVACVLFQRKMHILWHFSSRHSHMSSKPHAFSTEMTLEIFAHCPLTGFHKGS